MQIYMDKDYQDRTVFHLITLHSYPQLMEDDKITQLLDKLWQGELTYECDGIKTTQKVNVSHPYSMPKSNPNFKMPASANTCNDLVDKTLSGDVR